jgi:transcriptional regulator of acetoin/glycerol metabolism
MRILIGYSWPGNVRELKSTFEYAFVTCQDEVIQPQHLPPSIYQERRIINKIPKIPFNRDEMKKRRLIEALEKSKGNRSLAAEFLGVSRVTVWNQMKKFKVGLFRGKGAY